MSSFSQLTREDIRRYVTRSELLKESAFYGEYEIPRGNVDVCLRYPYLAGEVSNVGMRLDNQIVFGPFSKPKIRQLDGTGQSTWYSMASRMLSYPSGVAKNMLVALRTYPVGKREGVKIAVKGSRYIEGGGLGYLYYAMYLARWGPVSIDLYDYGEIKSTRILKMEQGEVIVQHIPTKYSGGDYEVVVDDAWVLGQGPVPLEKARIWSKKGEGEIFAHEAEKRNFSVTYQYPYRATCQCIVCQHTLGCFETRADYEWMMDMVAMLTPGRGSCSARGLDLELWNKGRMIYDLHRNSIVADVDERRRRALMIVNTEYPLSMTPHGVRLDYQSSLYALEITDKTINGPMVEVGKNAFLEGKSVTFHGVASSEIGLFRGDHKGPLVEVYRTIDQVKVTPPMADIVWIPGEMIGQWRATGHTYGLWKEYCRDQTTPEPRLIGSFLPIYENMKETLTYNPQLDIDNGVYAVSDEGWNRELYVSGEDQNILDYYGEARSLERLRPLAEGQELVSGSRGRGGRGRGKKPLRHRGKRK